MGELILDCSYQRTTSSIFFLW